MIMICYPQSKNNNLKPENSGLIFPTTPRQRSNPHPQEGLTNQIPHSPGTENSQMPGVCLGGGELNFRFDRHIMGNNVECKYKWNYYIRS